MKYQLSLKVITGLIIGLVFCLSPNAFALGALNPQVQTNPATNIQSTGAIFSGSVYDVGGYSTVNVWFQYGIDTSYTNATTIMIQNYTGSFSQQIINLAPNQTFHYRAVAQNSYGTSYGQDMYFTTGQSVNFINQGVLLPGIITKQGINLSSGNLQWSNYVNASPGDVLKFFISVQNISGQTLTNVIIRDSLPQNLTYYNDLMINGVINYGNIMSGINIGTLGPNQSAIISYQAQVASTQSFAGVNVILNNLVSMQSDQTGGNNITSNVIITVDTANVLWAASLIKTGLTNNFLTDSFLLPLIIVIGGLWFWKSEFIKSFIKMQRYEIITQ